MSQDKRLDKVEGSLTAKQTVILWLEEIRQYQNVYDYVQFLRSQPESAAPITRLTRQVEQAVQQAMKGRQKQVVEPAVRRATRDVVFLVKLHNQANFKVLTEQKAWNLLVLALAEMQDKILTENALLNICQKVNKQRQYRGQLSASLRPWQPISEHRAEELKLWKGVAVTFLVDLYSFQNAVTFVSQRYFDGNQILFADEDKCIMGLIKETEELVKMFNDSLTGETERDYRIDLDEVRKVSGRKTTEQTSLLVDMSKAEALDALGERQAAIELAERHL